MEGALLEEFRFFLGEGEKGEGQKRREGEKVLREGEKKK